MGMLTISFAIKATSGVMMKLGVREPALRVHQVFNLV
jgi:hypothetical protein